MKIWVIGAQGMLGSVLVQSCQRKGINVIGTSREEADILDYDRLSAKADKIKPTHMINCAAYTDVDGAEKEPDIAFAVNAEGAENAARAAKSCGAHLLHISTDYVFNGAASQPYCENDLCCPSNHYGKSKLEGERKVLQTMPESCILRTSWLFGSKGKNFISSLMNWFQQKEELQIVYDQRGKPTYCYDLAEAVLTLLNAKGIVHFANDSERSRYQIALDLMDACRQRRISLRCQRVIPVSSDKFPTLAARPLYSVLDTSKYFHITNIKPRPWGEVLNDYLLHYASLS